MQAILYCKIIKNIDLRGSDAIEQFHAVIL